MNSTPDEGESVSPEDNIDLPREPEEEAWLAESKDEATAEDRRIELELDVVGDASSEVLEEDPAVNEEVTSTSNPPAEDLQSEDETLSIPDDTPSIQGSILSSPRSETQSIATPDSRRSPTGSHRPFDRRFQSRLTSSPLNSPTAISTFLSSHSRQSSLASIALQTTPESDPSSLPWDVVRWTKLKKITAQAFSEAGKRNFGCPTCMTVTTNIVIGTSKGLILVFDYQQNHKGIIGMGTKAVECGAVTALAISADHTVIAAGHAGGHIFTWELARSARPFLHVQPVDISQAQVRRGDGHISGVSVLHIGFLGYRRTALVSADDHGMAFSHLATRGMGAIGRTVRTTRILGRYPDAVVRDQKPRKPSSVLAFSPLPLGNVEQRTDGLGLVAMMTPYLLVIVSTTPIAQTQHKSARPKEVAAHSAVSAALAWFPAIKLKGENGASSNTKLVYCWSNVLTVLEVTVVEPTEPVDKDKPPELDFRPRSRWKAEEAIVAVQWLNRSVLAVLTITQQLLVLEDVSMRVADSFDLLQKHIYHSDLHSQQLRSLVEQFDEEDSSMHGVVADSFHMSFRAYKGRLFLLGQNDSQVGSVSNWADRLLAMMNVGDFIGAIRLATSYYAGEGEKLSIGLPEDDDARHGVVREKLLEMISASLKYAFGRNQQAGPVELETLQLVQLARASVVACVSIGDHNFLFDIVYAWYADHEQSSVFLDVLEPYILDGRVISLPPAAVKALIDYFMATHTASKLEEIICLLDTSTMDIDQVTSLCKNYNLYDAYIYVWTKTLQDYISPLEELFRFAQMIPNGHLDPTANSANAQKIFPYLSFVWTGRTYPTGVSAGDEESDRAKGQVYGFFFASASVSASGRKRESETLAYPRLREILDFDASSFISVLNEAFEDGYLNSGNEQLNGVDGSSTNHQIINRQYIIRIMLEVMTPARFEPEDTLFLDMFIARNLPKYPQYILLSGTTLHQVIVRLCQIPSDDMSDDCQLSVEYLLSAYHPPDLQSLIPLFRAANFYRVLKAIFKSEREYAKLVDTYFLTIEDQDEVFAILRDCLLNGAMLTSRERREVLDVVGKRARELAQINVRQTATTFDQVDRSMHSVFLKAMGDDSRSQYEYLNAITEGESQQSPALIERYVQLMCQYNKPHVADFVETLSASDLHLDVVLPSMEESGVIDAAVVLLARQGQVKIAMERLTRHLSSLQAGLLGILCPAGSPGEINTNGAVKSLLQSIEKYSGVGIWLCQAQMKMAQKSRLAVKSPNQSSSGQSLSFEETLWLELINSVVTTVMSVSAGDRVDGQIAATARGIVQRVFTALLASTTSREGGDRDFSFLRILHGFLTQAAASSPSLCELRSVIRSIFSAYAYEESLLALANSMLDKDMFVHVDEIYKLRRRGWRPRGQICEVCRRRVWGPGTGTQIWGAWEKRQSKARHFEEDDMERGKGKATERTEQTNATQNMHSLGPVVVFSCRHLYHQACLRGERAHELLQQELVCPACV